LKITFTRRVGTKKRFGFTASARTKKTPPLPCVTVPLNLSETGGTRWIAFDFQSRPVGYNRNYNPVIYQLRFKDIVSIHEHRQGKSFSFETRFPKNPPRRRTGVLSVRISSAWAADSSKKCFPRKKFSGDSNCLALRALRNNFIERSDFKHKIFWTLWLRGHPPSCNKREISVGRPARRWSRTLLNRIILMARRGRDEFYGKPSRKEALSSADLQILESVNNPKRQPRL
jgi:hypothetical protein